MVISLDNADATRQLVFGSATLTYSFTRGSGIGAVVVNVAHSNGNVAPTITYGGESMTLVAGALMGARVDIWQGMFILLNPSTTGAQNVVITLLSAPSVIIATTISFSGGITNSFTNFNLISSALVSTIVNPITVGDQSWVVIGGGAATVNVTAGTNVTAATSANPLSGYFGPKSGSGSVSLTVNASVPDDMESITLELIPTGGGGGFFARPYYDQIPQRILNV